MKFWSVYAISNGDNDKTYIGATTKTVLQRFAQHLATSRIGGKTSLHKDIAALGAEKFSVACLCCCTTIDDAKFLERYFIDTMRTTAPNGYNNTPGGDLLPGKADNLIKTGMIGIRFTPFEQTAFYKACSDSRMTASALGGRVLVNWMQQEGYLPPLSTNSPASPARSPAGDKSDGRPEPGDAGLPS